MISRSALEKWYATLEIAIFHTELGARMHGFDSENILLDFSVLHSLKKEVEANMQLESNALAARPVHQT